ncbi:trehalose-6-phosphate synthase [Phenylobacterium sp.]|uniref:trehalose-6-phosphate synthase n=1 Tax=Phenylobacterium sp. TaxID=1871053 RepID=UPI00286CB1C2|nr:trehalose-6-phosphate synthase [Phenylobacterium sp.]
MSTKDLAVALPPPRPLVLSATALFLALDGALAPIVGRMVNPNSPEEIADALKRALAMDRTERVHRWQALFEGVSRHDVTAWRAAFVGTLEGVGERAVALAS